MTDPVAERIQSHPKYLEHSILTHHLVTQLLLEPAGLGDLSGPIVKIVH